MTDVIVVGAGLAGLTAAREVRAAGLSVLVLEARERVGGRTFSVPCAAVGSPVDLGAEWLTQGAHVALMTEIRRYGLSTVAPSSPPLPSAGDLVAAFARLDADARRIDFDRPDWHAGLDDLDVPFASYLDGLGRSSGALLSRAFALMGADERECSALGLLHEVAGFGSAEAAFDGDSRRIGGGADGVARAIAASLGDLVRLGSPVTAVTAAADHCVVTTPSGTFTAGAVIVAVPVNTLADIAFDPSVPVPSPHCGRVAKIWAPVDGVAPGVVRTSWPGVVETYTFGGPGGVAVAAFQLRDGDAGDQERAALEELGDAFPGAGFGAAFWHDWCADPYAKGTWSASRPGQFASWQALADQAGPVFFAGGDLSRRWIGWMDGAVTSGMDSGRRAEAYLAGKPVLGARG